MSFQPDTPLPILLRLMESARTLADSAPQRADYPTTPHIFESAHYRWATTVVTVGSTFSESDRLRLYGFIQTLLKTEAN